MPKVDNPYTPKDHPEYKKEDLRELLKYLQNKVHKLYVYIASESGLRAQTILKLRIKHIQEDLDNNRQPVAIRLDKTFYKGKKRAGLTFLGTQSITMLKDCQANKLVGTQPDDRLVPLAYSTIHQVLQRAKKDADIKKDIQPSHGMRKYFENALDKATIDKDQKWRIEGHKNGARDNYTTKDFDELRPAYLTAYPHINIDDPTDTAIAKTIQDTENDVKKLKDQIATLTDKYQKLADDTEKKIQQLLQAANAAGIRSDRLPTPPGQSPWEQPATIKLTPTQEQEIHKIANDQKRLKQIPPEFRQILIQASQELKNKPKPSE